MHTNTANPGARVVRNPGRELIEAQRERVYRIAGEPLPRVPFTGELCADCFAKHGQYHVPGCEHELCPACGGPVIACECAYGRAKSDRS